MNAFFIINIKESTKEEVTFFLDLLYDKNIVTNKLNKYSYSNYVIISDYKIYNIEKSSINYIESSIDYIDYKKVHFNNINHYLRFLKINKIRNKNG